MNKIIKPDATRKTMPDGLSTDQLRAFVLENRWKNFDILYYSYFFIRSWKVSIYEKLNTFIGK